jgi:hypothetical protein
LVLACLHVFVSVLMEVERGAIGRSSIPVATAAKVNE